MANRIDLILDANVIIALRHVDKLTYFVDFLLKSQPDFHVHMPKEIYDECLPQDHRELQRLTTLHIYSRQQIDLNLIRQVKFDVIQYYGKIHTSEKDADYLVLALAVKINNCVLCTNDWDLYWASNTYKRRAAKNKMTVRDIPALITLMRLSDATMLNDRDAATMNCDVFKISELQNIFTQVTNGMWNLSKCQNKYNIYKEALLDLPALK